MLLESDFVVCNLSKEKIVGNGFIKVDFYVIRHIFIVNT